MVNNRPSILCARGETFDWRISIRIEKLDKRKQPSFKNRTCIEVMSLGTDLLQIEARFGSPA